MMALRASITYLFRVATTFALLWTVPVQAEVYVELPLSPVEGFVLGLSGSRAAADSAVTVQGLDYRISRWSLSQNVALVAAAIEMRTDQLLVGENGGDDAIQYVDDELAVFAALADGEAEAAEAEFPSYVRTILLRPLGAGTEMIVTDRIGAAPEGARIADLTQAMRWSLDGEWPEWQSSESLVSVWRQTLMFVTDMSDNDRISARRSQLEAGGFNILDITASHNGTLISAANDHELVSAFSYIDDDGASVEVVVHEIHSDKNG